MVQPSIRQQFQLVGICTRWYSQFKPSFRAKHETKFRLVCTEYVLIDQKAGNFVFPIHLDNFFINLPSMAASAYMLRATTTPFFSFLHNQPSSLKRNAVSLNPSFRLPSLSSIRLSSPNRRRLRLPHYKVLNFSASTSSPYFPTMCTKKPRRNSAGGVASPEKGPTLHEMAMEALCMAMHAMQAPVGRPSSSCCLCSPAPCHLSRPPVEEWAAIPMVPVLRLPLRIHLRLRLRTHLRVADAPLGLQTITLLKMISMILLGFSSSSSAL